MLAHTFKILYAGLGSLPVQGHHPNPSSLYFIRARTFLIYKAPLPSPNTHHLHHHHHHHHHRFGKRAQFVTSGFRIKAANPTREIEMEVLVVTRAEELVRRAMKGNDASHDAAHAFRVRDLALSLAHEEGLSSSPDSLLIVELAALLHDIGDYKYAKELSEEAVIVERFLGEEGLDESIKEKILKIIKGMGFKDELAQIACHDSCPEFGVVQDADRLDAIGAIGIARCFTFGGNRMQVLHDPAIQPRLTLSKEDYMKKDEKQTTVNHFHEKLLKLKDLMKTKAGQRRAEKRHKFMQDFLAEFYEEWDGRA